MKEENLRDKQVAWALKVTPGLVGQWRRGVRVPSDKVQAFCRVLNVSAHWILFGEGPMRPVSDWQNLSFSEWEIISAFRNLSQTSRSGVELLFAGLKSGNKHHATPTDPFSDKAAPISQNNPLSEFPAQSAHDRPRQ